MVLECGETAAGGSNDWQRRLSVGSSIGSPQPLAGRVRRFRSPHLRCRLQLAYNLESVAVRTETELPHKAFTELNPLANAAADVVHGRFVSWKTSAIIKDNRVRRDYSFVEFVSAMGGPDVKFLQRGSWSCP